MSKKMVKHRYAKRILLCLLILSLIPVRWFGLFEPLPFLPTARQVLGQNDEWIAESVEELTELATTIVKVEVLQRDTIILGAGRDDPMFSRRSNLFSIYELGVLEVYRGNVSQGEVIEMIQIRALHGRSPAFMLFAWTSHLWNPPPSYYTRVSFEVGEQLILFLERGADRNVSATRGASAGIDSSLWWPFLSPSSDIAHLPFNEQLIYLQSLFYMVNPIQGAYYATVLEGGIFQSVHVSNNLELREEDLVAMFQR